VLSLARPRLCLRALEVGAGEPAHGRAQPHAGHARSWRALPHDLPPWQTAYYSEGCEPLLQHLVVHDDDSSPWVVAGLMMGWPGLPAGSSAGIGYIEGLRRGALRLQERVG
jgi:hypothetical protein